MAGLAERHQIILSMATTLISGDNMMDFSDRNIASTLKTFLAERMLGNI
jgi:uncharacterized protein (DUF2249 family)